MKRAITAEEFLKMKNMDPKHRAMLDEKERRRSELDEKYSREERPLVETLNAAGSNVTSVWDLVNMTESYPYLLPMLCEHLTLPYHPRIREGIVRALAVKEARGTDIPRIIMDELGKMTNPRDAIEHSCRAAMINTLVFIGDGSLQKDVKKLLKVPCYADNVIDLKRLAAAIRKNS